MLLPTSKMLQKNNELVVVDCLFDSDWCVGIVEIGNYDFDSVFILDHFSL